MAPRQRPPVTGKGKAKPADPLPAEPEAGTQGDTPDRDGVGEVTSAEPMGRPNSDRHKMETTIARLRKHQEE